MSLKKIDGQAPRSVRASSERPLPPGLVLGIAVAAMSWGGPLVRFATAPALAVAAWRLLLSVAVIAVVLTLRRRWGDLVGLTAGDKGLAVAAGIFLAAHFWSWISSLYWTSVASSVVLVNTQPIFVALLSTLVLGERAGVRQWLGIGIAFAGAAVIGWGDSGRGASALLGDVLAVAGALFASGYFVIGRRLRQRLDLWAYTGIVYGVAAVVLAAAVVLDPDVSLTGYPTTDWLVFAALAAVPMLIGHTGLNYALRFMPAFVVGLAILGEPVGATLIAWLVPAIGEPPTIQLVVGGGMIGAGILLGVLRHA